MSFTMPHEVRYGHIPVSTKTPLGKLLWESELKPDYRPENHPYPKMLYKAYKRDGKVMCMDTHPKPFFFVNPEQYRQAVEAVDNWNLSCQMTVGLNEKGEDCPEAGPAQHRAAAANGWRESQQEAIQYLIDFDLEMAREASRTNFGNKNMSPAAKAEFQAAEDATPEYVVSLPEKPTVKKPHHMSKEARAARASAKVTA